MQSAFFDGRQANWYHFGCFYKTSVVRSPNEVSGFSSLRWEDQERIRKKISGASGGGGGEDSTDSPAPSKGKRKTTRSDLMVEYAKSNRSTCKGCNSQISKVGWGVQWGGLGIELGVQGWAGYGVRCAVSCIHHTLAHSHIGMLLREFEGQDLVKICMPFYSS